MGGQAIRPDGQRLPRPQRIDGEQPVGHGGVAHVVELDAALGEATNALGREWLAEGGCALRGHLSIHAALLAFL
ncbi:Uncharacterised protein [Mycobacteroides abscessus subsp. abscessus]|nr:Uncharacterised protein [Mycobacteroides abscessus subsp. abscessus]